jgi:hypothetical protein
VGCCEGSIKAFQCKEELTKAEKQVLLSNTLFDAIQIVLFKMPIVGWSISHPRAYGGVVGGACNSRARSHKLLATWLVWFTGKKPVLSEQSWISSKNRSASRQCGPSFSIADGEK